LVAHGFILPIFERYWAMPLSSCLDTGEELVGNSSGESPVSCAMLKLLVPREECCLKWRFSLVEPST